MNDINRKENARLEKIKGDSSWEEAAILFEKEKYDGAVSRAYYAAFHYACACLLTKGLEARSHQALQRLFHLHFIARLCWMWPLGNVCKTLSSWWARERGES